NANPSGLSPFPRLSDLAVPGLEKLLSFCPAASGKVAPSKHLCLRIAKGAQWTGARKPGRDPGEKCGDRNRPLTSLPAFAVFPWRLIAGRGHGGPGVAFRWRIRHKLMLGLGLVIGVMALLLAGTLYGLA